MRYHSINGISIENLSSEILQECLVDGLWVNENSESEPNAIESGIEQIKIELLARSLGYK